MEGKGGGIGPLLETIVSATGADGGAELLLDDGEGVLQSVARTVPASSARRGLRKRRTAASDDRPPLMVSVPDAHGGVLCFDARVMRENPWPTVLWLACTFDNWPVM